MKLAYLGFKKKKTSEDIYLIVDGHRSRIYSIAIEYFNRNRVNLIILLSHTSHFCQSFDVGFGLSYEEAN